MNAVQGRMGAGAVNRNDAVRQIFAGRKAQPGPYGLTSREFAVFCSVFEIDSPARLRALSTAYQVSWQYLAPFITKVAADMLPDLKRITAANYRAQVIFIGRDGFSLGYVIRQMDPLFHNQRCREFQVSRSMADAAVHEAESWPLTGLGGIAAFRKDGPHRSPTRARTGWQDLVQAFERDAAYLDRSGAEFVLVDTGYKGSIQEMLAAAFPTAKFHGCYVFCGESPDDPHPGTKKGYALHLHAENSFGGRAIRDHLLDDPDLTFAHHDAIVAVEELLKGADSPASASAKPGNESCLAGLNPIRVAHEYTTNSVREAVLAMVLRATSDYAALYAATQGPAIRIARAALAEGAERLRRELHDWMARRPGHSALRRLLDSFVRRADKDLVERLAGAMQAMALTPAQRHALWAGFDACDSLTCKEHLVTSCTHTPQSAQEIARTLLAAKGR